MQKQQDKISKKMLAVPIVVIAIAVGITTIENVVFETPPDTPFSKEVSTNGITSDTNVQTSSTYTVFSGPFSINNWKYNVDETLFFIGSEIPLDQRGEIIFTRPDGKVDHTIPFDGSKGPVKHYFTPVQSDDLDGCSNCFFGPWNIIFRTTNGISYDPIPFVVVEN